MKTIYEQVANKCIHFNGIMNKSCKAGIVYSEVRTDDRPFKFPCLNQGGYCKLCQFRTPEEVEKHIAKSEKDAMESIAAYMKVLEHFTKTKERNGKIKCECGGTLHFTVANINNHIWAKCTSCGVSFVHKTGV